MPTLTAPSASVFTHWCVVVYLRSLGMAMLIRRLRSGCREQVEPETRGIQIAGIEVEPHGDLRVGRNAGRDIAAAIQVFPREENPARERVLLRVRKDEIE